MKQDELSQGSEPLKPYHYEIEKIRGMRGRKLKAEYWIPWEVFCPMDNTWEPEKGVEVAAAWSLVQTEHWCDSSTFRNVEQHWLELLWKVMIIRRWRLTTHNYFMLPLTTVEMVFQGIFKRGTETHMRSPFALLQKTIMVFLQLPIRFWSFDDLTQCKRWSS